MKKDEQKGNIKNYINKIIPVDISTEMKSSFITYAMSVITSRALPDIRDGLKPVHRRILYAMYELGLTPGSRFRKSATVVGDVLGKYHPHGDSSVYMAMVNMAQDFSYRYPLIWGQGNFGSIDGDSPAAMRYTEAKMAPLTVELLRDIEKETVDFGPNYDDTRKEPLVLPTRVPVLLLNGQLGIAVGMATNIPPHNLAEVIDATILLIKNKNAGIDEIMEHIKGPDFPLGGLVYNIEDIKNAYVSGRGRVVTRGEAEIVEGKKGRMSIVIHSLPYRVNKQNLIMKIADLVKEKKIKGIKTLRDESTKDVRIVIELKSSSQPKRILNYLYKHTDLEMNFNFNMVALVDGIPRTLGIKDILLLFIEHRKEVIIRRTRFELKKAEERAHILEGLSKALHHIDKIISLIKKSKDTKDAKEKLMKEFSFSEIQAKAILDMKLQKLAGLERKKIEDELNSLREEIKRLKEILSSEKKVLSLIKEELVEIKEKYADQRRTKIIPGAVDQIQLEDLIPQKEYAMIFTENGYIKRTDPAEYRSQKRGGLGVLDMNTYDDDMVTHFLIANSHSKILFFTDKGKVYRTKMYDLPEGKRATRGKSIKNFLNLESDEKVKSILAVPKGEELSSADLFFVTKKGIVKKVPGDAFSNVRSRGIIAMTLKEGDDLLDVRFVYSNDEIILVSEKGQSIRFPLEEIRRMGRNAAGVRGMSLKDGDYVVGTGVVRAKGGDLELLVISENGYGKRTKLSEYKIQKRGGSGVKTFNVTEKTGNLVGARIVYEGVKEIITMSKQSQVIRTNLENIPVLGRATQGVRIMKLKEGDRVASFTLL